VTVDPLGPVNDVRAITVRQPWAWAIAAGHKLVENRSQGTKYRGPLIIHAGKQWSDRGRQDSRVVEVWKAAGYPMWPATARHSGGVAMQRALTPLGEVIAVAQLVDSHPDAGCCRPWGESSYTEGDGKLRTAVHHLVLEDVRALEFGTPARGALGLWRPDVDLVRWLTEQDLLSR
jgi:hypothetical protein